MKSTINNDPYDIDKLVEESEGPEDVGGHLDCLQQLGQRF